MFDVAPQHGIRRLHARHRCDRVHPGELIGVEVRRAEVPHLSLAPQLAHRVPGILESAGVVINGRARPFRPVNLVQVDALHAQPPQARLALPADRLGPQAVCHRAIVVPHEAALREDVGALVEGNVAQCLADDRLGAAEPIGRGRVDPVDAPIERAPIAAIESPSSCGPHPKRHAPPMAQAPRPIRVISRSECPSCLVCMSAP